MQLLLLLHNLFLFLPPKKSQLFSSLTLFILYYMNFLSNASRTPSSEKEMPKRWNLYTEDEVSHEQVYEVIIISLMKSIRKTESCVKQSENHSTTKTVLNGNQMRYISELFEGNCDWKRRSWKSTRNCRHFFKDLIIWYFYFSADLTMKCRETWMLKRTTKWLYA